MNLKELIRTMIYQYPMILTGTIFAAIGCLISKPDFMFNVWYLVQLVLFSLAANLPLVAYYSKKELTPKQFRIRMVIHFILLETVLLGVGYWIGLYDGILGGVIFFFIVMAVEVFVLFLTFLGNRKMASDINEMLKLRRSSKDNTKN